MRLILRARRRSTENQGHQAGQYDVNHSELSVLSVALVELSVALIG
jgi:hypothetical protein